MMMTCLGSMDTEIIGGVMMITLILLLILKGIIQAKKENEKDQN